MFFPGGCNFYFDAFLLHPVALAHCCVVRVRELNIWKKKPAGGRSVLAGWTFKMCLAVRSLMSGSLHFTPPLYMKTSGLQKSVFTLLSSIVCGSVYLATNDIDLCLCRICLDIAVAVNVHHISQIRILFLCACLGHINACGADYCDLWYRSSVSL